MYIIRSYAFFICLRPQFTSNRETSILGNHLGFFFLLTVSILQFFGSISISGRLFISSLLFVTLFLQSSISTAGDSYIQFFKCGHKKKSQGVVSQGQDGTMSVFANNEIYKKILGKTMLFLEICARAENSSPVIYKRYRSFKKYRTYNSSLPLTATCISIFQGTAESLWKRVDYMSPIFLYFKN